jgi:hypothetical protein
MADGLIVVVVIAGGVLVMASSALETRHTVKRVLPRLIMAVVLCNLSLPLCGWLIQATNALSRALLDIGAGDAAWPLIASAASGQGLLAPVVLPLVSIATAVLAFVLVIVYIARDVLLLVLVVASPLALLAYAVPNLESVAALWWRAFSVLLFVQVGHALLAAVGVMVLRHPAWLTGSPDMVVDAVLVTALLWVMLKLPFWAYQWASHHPSPHHQVGAYARRAQRAVQVVKVIAATAGKAAAAL